MSRTVLGLETVPVPVPELELELELELAMAMDLDLDLATELDLAMVLGLATELDLGMVLELELGILYHRMDRMGLTADLVMVTVRGLVSEHKCQYTTALGLAAAVERELDPDQGTMQSVSQCRR